MEIPVYKSRFFNSFRKPHITYKSMGLHMIFGLLCNTKPKGYQIKVYNIEIQEIFFFYKLPTSWYVILKVI